MLSSGVIDLACSPDGHLPARAAGPLAGELAKGSPASGFAGWVVATVTRRPAVR
jgi:hypothetical protein